MRSKLNSIRFLISIITIVILVVAIGVAYVASRGLSYQHVDEDMQISVRNKLNYLQGSAEQLIRAGMSDILYQIVSSVASEPDLISVLVVDQDHVDEALIHYQDDLGIGNRLPRCTQHPDNIWALHGYHECLLRLGREDEAAAIKPRLDEMIRQSDSEIKSSCCCRGMSKDSVIPA